MSPIIQNFPDATLVPNGDGTYRLGVDIGQAISVNVTGVSIAGNMNQGNAGAQAWPVSLPAGTNVSGTMNQGLPGTQAWPVSLPTGTSFGAVAQGSAGASAWPVSLASIPTGTVIQGNSPWGVSEQAATMPAGVVMQNAVSGNATGTSLSVSGMALAMLQITSSPAMASGTSVQFFGSEDGVTYYPVSAHQMGILANLVVSTTVDGIYRISCAGLNYIQARIVGYITGTVTITGYSTPTAAHATSVTGLMGGFSTQLSVVINMTTGSSYVTGDYVGNASPLTFANVARVAGGTFYLPGATLIDYAVQSKAGELWLFDAQITPPADSAAWSISDADSAHLLTVIPFSTYYASALNSVSLGHPDYVGPYKCAAGDTSVYGYYVTRDAPAYVTGCLTIKLGSAQD
jgi:hypothetical protein